MLTGEFGIVYKAQVKKGFSDTISDLVAVKTLKGILALPKYFVYQ